MGLEVSFLPATSAILLLLFSITHANLFFLSQGSTLSVPFVFAGTFSSRMIDVHVAFTFPLLQRWLVVAAQNESAVSV
jgi:hypothetical protein